MVQLRPPGKAYEIAKKILKEQGVKVPKRDVIQPVTIRGPYLQH